jgi:hypothetical protein
MTVLRPNKEGVVPRYRSLAGIQSAFWIAHAAHAGDGEGDEAKSVLIFNVLSVACRGLPSSDAGNRTRTRRNGAQGQ